MTRPDREPLLARYLEGTLSAEDEAALLDLLRDDPGAADELEAFLRLDEGLREALVHEASGDALTRAVAERLRENGRTDHFARAVVERLQTEEKTEKPGTRRIRRVHLRRGTSSGPGPWGAALMAAAALFMLVVLASVSGSGKGPRPPAPRPMADAPAPLPPVAIETPLPPKPEEGRALREERERQILEELARIEREDEEIRKRAEAADQAKQKELRLKADQELAEAAALYRKKLEELAVAKQADPEVPKAPTPATQAAVATLERAEAAVVVSDGGLLPARAGMDLLPGQGLDVSGTAVVVYRDGTRLELAGGTEVRGLLEAERPGAGAKGKRLAVARGTVTAEVAKQPLRQPMVFTTPHGEATVLGTTLRLAVDAASTRLDVMEGKVKLTPKDAKAAEVTSGHYAVAAVGIDTAAKQQPVDDILLLASKAVLYGGEWRRVADPRAFDKIAVEAPQVWNGATTEGPARLKKGTLGFMEFTFRAEADRDYHIWVRGARGLAGAPNGSGNEWYRFDYVAIEPVDALPVSKHMPVQAGRAYEFNGYGQLDGYWWISGNADPGIATMPQGKPGNPAPVTVRFAKPGMQKLRVYPIETPLRIDAVWLSTTQKTRPAENQKQPELPKK